MALTETGLNTCTGGVDANTGADDADTDGEATTLGLPEIVAELGAALISVGLAELAVATVGEGFPECSRSATVEP